MPACSQAVDCRVTSVKLATTLCTLGLVLAAGCAAAQSVYRSVDANGKVSFSDQPSASNAGASTNIIARVGNAGQGTAPLPYALRRIADRYPVTLYTGNECAPCMTGRSLLVIRGIPFVERTVTTSADSDALQRISGQKSLPVLGVGAKQLKGFSNVEWSQYLDAAGYPKSSSLPVAYRKAPATPLTAVRATSTATAASTTPSAGNAPMPSAPRSSAVTAPNPNNPAGIRF